jgi:hypothetical protein
MLLRGRELRLLTPRWNWLSASVYAAQQLYRDHRELATNLIRRDRKRLRDCDPKGTCGPCVDDKCDLRRLLGWISRTSTNIVTCHSRYTRSRSAARRNGWLGVITNVDDSGLDEGNHLVGRSTSRERSDFAGADRK